MGLANEIAAKLRGTADEIELIGAAKLPEVMGPLTLADALRILAAHHGGKAYMVIKMELTHRDGEAKAEWFVYVESKGWDGPAPTLTMAVEVSTRTLAKEDVIQAAQVALADPLPF